MESQTVSSVPGSPPPSKTSGLAIASLILGCLSLVCIGLCGTVPAVICGVIALNKIGKSGGALTGQGLAIAGIVTGGIGIFSTAILAGMLLPALTGAREKAREAVCLNNVRQITFACIQYSQQHEGILPSNLDQTAPFLFAPPSGKSRSILVCPSARDSKTPSYRIVGGGSTVSSSPATTVLVEELGQYHPRSRVVGYQDGHVESQGSSGTQRRR